MIRVRRRHSNTPSTPSRPFWEINGTEKLLPVLPAPKRLFSLDGAAHHHTEANSIDIKTPPTWCRILRYSQVAQGTESVEDPVGQCGELIFA